MSSNYISPKALALIPWSLIPSDVSCVESVLAARLLPLKLCIGWLPMLAAHMRHRMRAKEAQH